MARRGGHLSAAHRAAISASLKGRSGKSRAVHTANTKQKAFGSAVVSARANLRANANSSPKKYNAAAKQLRTVKPYRNNPGPKAMQDMRMNIAASALAKHGKRDPILAAGMRRAINKRLGPPRKKARR